MIKVALPNKGGLYEPAIDLFASCGYRVARPNGVLTVIDTDNEVEFYFLRPGDIPLYISNGILDAGVTGKDFVAEKCLGPLELLDLNFGHSRLCAAVPFDHPAKSLEDVAAMRIATSFPAIVRRYFEGRDLKLVELEGAVEISVRLGIAEAVVDVVDTGRTLQESGLRVVGDPLFRSQAAFFAHPGREKFDQVLVMQKRLAGKLVALEYMMVEYDVPADILPAACQVTPGIEAPTVSPLQTAGWFAVKAMIRRNEAHRLMDELARIGCKGILLTNIESARI